MEIIYNPSLRFKNEGSRCIAYSIDDFFHNVENLTVLSPQEVIKLLLFDGSADFSTIAERIAYVFSFPITDKLDIVKKIKADIKSIETRMNFSPLLVPVSNFSEKIIEKTKQRYKIADFFINKKDINLQRYNLRVSAPLSVNFNVSTSCRFNCKYCYHPLYGLKDYISLDRLTQLFKEFKDNGCESVLLAGGDPMLRSDILDIMIALYKTGLFYTISTKSILSIEQIKKMIDKAGFDRIQLSIDSLDINTVKYLLGINNDNYLKNMVKTVEFLLKNNIDVRIKAVLTRYNADNLKEFLFFWKKLGVKYGQVVKYARTPFRHTDDLFPTKIQFKAVKDTISEFKALYPDFHLLDDRFCTNYRKPITPKNINDSNLFLHRGVCSAGRFSLTMLQNGEVFICENLPYRKEFILGDLRKQSVMEYWNSDRVKQWLSPPTRNIFADNVPCKTCRQDLYNICHSNFSRCLRFTYETFGTTNHGDVNCPHINFKKYRIE